MRRAILMLCVLFATVAACGQGSSATGPQAPASQGGQPQATPTPTVGAGGSGTAVSHLEVQGGPQAGSYDATGPKSDCNMSATGSGATYGDTAKTEGLSLLMFSSGEGGASPAKFYFLVGFGATIMSQPVLEISTLDPTTANGSGTAVLDDKGATIKWTIAGTTKDGAKIKATIECGPVDRR
jgi:hypothetical protein